MDDNFNPGIFIKIGQLLCSDEYIYYNGFFFQEDIDRYEQDEEIIYTIKKNILTDIHNYFTIRNNNEVKELKIQIIELKIQIKELQIQIKNLIKKEK